MLIMAHYKQTCTVIYIYIYTHNISTHSLSLTQHFSFHSGTILQLPVLVRLSDTGKVLQHVSNGELHSDSRPRVAAVYQALKVLVLPNELVLHDVPHDLVDRTKFTLNNLKTFEI